MNKFEVLKHYFGYESFREGQEELVDNILNGRDAFGVMPTGSGKSICFQVPALLFDGITLVVSPLISLMKDQVSALTHAGVKGAFLNSSLNAAQYDKALSFAKNGNYKIVYVAPERLLTDSFLSFALNVDISMLVVDEAHCVSQWGQDFRPSYLKIIEFVQLLKKRPVISAFTATATLEVKQDIIDILRLNDPFVMTTGFDRPNLFLSVESPQDKYEAVKKYIGSHPNCSGIIYCLARKTVEEVCEKLCAEGILATRYHAGLSDEERRTNQDAFIFDQAPVMVATNAFGMGIDKSNVRFVIHYNMPKNPEAYYQEIGRCARDGEVGECVLLYASTDVRTNQWFIENVSENQELGPQVKKIIIEKDRERLKKITFYCFTDDCLREHMLRYFGEFSSNYCGNCSNCLTQFESVDVTKEAKLIFNCIEKSSQRYGINVIIDTLRGGNTIKIRQYQMDENEYYNTLGDVNIKKIRKIINFLIEKEYLSVTNDEYAILKLTQTSALALQSEDKILMKLLKEKEKPAKEKPSRGSAENYLKDDALFAKLKLLRLEIAKEEKVPPYIVFSDKTLTLISSAKPKSKDEMLSISGVGEFKFEKYGKRFLEII